MNSTRQKYRLPWLPFPKLPVRDLLAAALVIFLSGFLLWYEDWQESAVPPAANVISGYADITDGDTIVVQGKRIRIVGIDAPETKQFCYKDTEQFACGQLSTAHMVRLIDNRPVRCQWLEKDIYNRFLGHCMAGATDLNRSMVLDGWAISYASYPDEEKFARANKLGIWQWQFQRPREWRRAHPFR